MIDAHAHLDFPDFAKDLPAVLARAWEAGLSAIVTIGTDLSTSRAAVRLAEADARVFATVGFHPHDAKDCTEDAFAEIRRLLAHPRVVALGEVGLDFVKEYSPRDVQERWLRRFLHLAAESGKPLVVHCRGAHAEILAILREEGLLPYRGMFHCYSGDAETARALLDLGFDLSFTGTITYPKSESVREAARRAPGDRVHVETDCPFLAPVPVRGRRNEPAFVRHVLAALADLRGVVFDEAERATETNTRRLFGLPGAA